MSYSSSASVTTTHSLCSAPVLSITSTWPPPPLPGWSLSKLPWQHADAVTSVIKTSPLMVVLKCFLWLKNRAFCPISVPLQQLPDLQDNGNTLYEQTATFSSSDQTIWVNWGRHDMSLQTQQIPIQCFKMSNQWVLAHSNISNEAAYISVVNLLQLLEGCLFIFLSNCHSILQPFVSHPSTCWQFDWHCPWVKDFSFALFMDVKLPFELWVLYSKGLKLATITQARIKYKHFLYSTWTWLALLLTHTKYF